MYLSESEKEKETNMVSCVLVMVTNSDPARSLEFS